METTCIPPSTRQNYYFLYAARAEAFRLYDSAIRQLQSALQDPVQRVSDEMLGAVLLMGTFETIAFADTGSLKALSQHIIAAARCIEMRGPAQFQTVIKTCHQLQEPIPFEISKWPSWAERSQNSDLVPVNRFSEINEVLASVRAELKYQHITDPAVISDRLLKIDKLFENWAQTLPPSWVYTSYKSIGPNVVPSSRLLIPDSIIIATLKHGTAEQKDAL
ncbi:hypothetical protein FAGAP_11213 [Fusarium agapanthi]|uniref:Uncharacterized protein n=1 Tax=Fusarium agapanthi TaxID=1803897 RepID=A0A9P5AZF9_9HYPO|nr:hypothetical protein FAGAP_11213 [Fusarium agapanthi]